MKVSISWHAVNTWLVAQLLHPVIYVLATVLYGGVDMDWDILALIAVFGLVCSMPGIFLLVFVLKKVVRFPLQMHWAALFVWVLSAILTVLLSGFFLLCWFDGLRGMSRLSWDTIQPFIPAMVSAVISILIRYKQFVRLFFSWHQTEITEQDNQISL